MNTFIKYLAAMFIIAISMLGQGCVKKAAWVDIDHKTKFDPSQYLRPGWSSNEHDERNAKLSSINLYDLELINPLKTAEGKILYGEERFDYTKTYSQIRLDANALRAILKNQSMIPKEWRNKVICFDGAIFRDADGHRCFFCLYWHDNWHCKLLYFSTPIFNNYVSAVYRNK